jgi:hypothetical protein
MRFLVVFFLISFQISGQVVQNVEVELVGRPSWQNLIPLSENGLLMLSKTDQTKAKIIKFDQDLTRLWEVDFYLDVERAPTAYTVDAENVTFLFRETSGMYYQVYIFDLKTGKFENKGFELREFFDDQSYVFFKKRILMAGANQKGGAFFEYNFETDEGKLIEIDLPGQVKVQEFKYNALDNRIESLWAIKTIGYSNEKKKRGAFTKDAYLAQIDFDTLGNVLKINKIMQKSGNFPVSGKLLKTSSGAYSVVGAYQTNIGERGLFYVPNTANLSKISFFSFTELLKKTPDITQANFGKQLKNLQFKMNDPILTNESLTVGGVFFEQINNDTYQGNTNGTNSSVKIPLFGKSNSKYQPTSSGIHFSTGFVANFSKNGDLLFSNKVDLNQISPTLKQSLAYNSSGAVAYCFNGNLAARNFNIGTKPVIYKLSEETENKKNQVYLPLYQEIRFWYDNFFIANGSKTKIEVLKLENNNKSSTSKKKKSKPSTFTQIRKTIYLTKIASGVAGQ